MVESTAFICFVILLVCLFASFVRVAIGPTLADRVLASDNIFMNLIGMVVLYSVQHKTPYYFDLVLVFALLGFVGTVCFAKYLGKGKIVE